MWLAEYRAERYRRVKLIDDIVKLPTPLKVRTVAERELLQPKVCKTCGFRRFCSGERKCMRVVCCAVESGFFYEKQQWVSAQAEEQPDH